MGGCHLTGPNRKFAQLGVYIILEKYLNQWEYG